MKSVLILYPLALSFYVEAITKLGLSEYMKPCEKDDPNWIECFIKSANEVIPHLVKGSSTYGIPVIDPLSEYGNHYDKALNVSNMVVHGLKEAKLTMISVDPANLRVNETFFVKSLNATLDYSVNSIYFGETVEATGRNEVQMTDVTILESLHLQLVEKDGMIYTEVVDGKAHVIPKKVVYVPISFKGDQDQFNRLLQTANDKWEEALKDFGHAIDHQVNAAHMRIAALFADSLLKQFSR